MNRTIVAELEKKFMYTVAVCKNKYGYNPTRFLQMVEAYGAVETAILLVRDSKIHEGLEKLWEFKRLDLSVEAIICQEPYCKLFPEEILSKAKIRLKELGYSIA